MTTTMKVTDLENDRCPKCGVPMLDMKDYRAENAVLREAIVPFAAIGALLKIAGVEALPDDVSARFLKLDGLQAKHFREAATAYQHNAPGKSDG